VKARGEKRLGNPKNLAEAQRKGAAKGAGQDVDGDAGVQRAGTGGGVNMIDDLRTLCASLGGIATLRDYAFSPSLHAALALDCCFAFHFRRFLRGRLGRYGRGGGSSALRPRQ
jgi:hypothetical protein